MQAYHETHRFRYSHNAMFCLFLAHEYIQHVFVCVQFKGEETAGGTGKLKLEAATRKERRGRLT
jgi:hypothetical protein